MEAGNQNCLPCGMDHFILGYAAAFHYQVITQRPLNIVGKIGMAAGFNLEQFCIMAVAERLAGNSLFNQIGLLARPAFKIKRQNKGARIAAIIIYTYRLPGNALSASLIEAAGFLKYGFCSTADII